MQADPIDLERLEEDDHSNFATNLNMVRQVDARSIEAINAYARLLDGAGTAFGNAAGISKNERVVGQWSDSVPMAPDAATQMLDEAILLGSKGIEDDAAVAKRHLVEGKGKWARLRLFQRLRRDFDLGIIELLRNHAVSSMGYLRVQSETIALAAAIVEKPEMGSEWWDAISMDAGKAFHAKHNSRIRGLVKEVGLEMYYQLGSAMAMHSRLAGVVNGIMYGGEPEVTDDKVTLKITYQDIDDARLLFIYFANYLLAHVAVAKALPRCMPEVKSVELGGLIGEYVTPVNGVLETARRVMQKGGFAPE